MQSKTLYERLGSAAGIARIVDDIVAAHMQNGTVSPRFLPILDEPERLAVIKKHTCQFLAAGSGGPQEYDGKEMMDVHRGMNISDNEYAAVVDDIMSTLVKHDIDEATRNDVLAITYALRPAIVRV